MSKEQSRLAVFGVLAIPLALTAACAEQSTLREDIGNLRASAVEAKAQAERAAKYNEALLKQLTESKEAAARTADQNKALLASLAASAAEAKAEAARAANAATEAFKFARAADKSAAALGRQKAAVRVKVLLGSPDGKLEFQPNSLVFETDKLYTLALENPSNKPHAFSAPEFTQAIFTENVRVNGAEVTGRVYNVTVPPGGRVEWSFVGVQPGTYQLEDSVPGHAEAGMRGTIAIR